MKSKCIPINPSSHQPTARLHIVHKGGRLMGLQQHQNQRRRRMESCIPNTRGTVRTNCDVLWTHKLTCYLPDDDEYHLSNQGRSRVALHVYGQHRNPYQTRRKQNRTTTLGTAPTLYPSHAPQAGTERPIPKT